jgi:hypothetical protein
VCFEGFQRGDVKDVAVGGSKDYRSSYSVVIGSEPVSRGHAPAITRHETRKVVLRHCCRQVVSNARLVVEELPSHDRADGVAAMVAFICVTGAIAEEACYGIDSTRFEFRSENVQWHLLAPAVNWASYVTLRM